MFGIFGKKSPKFFKTSLLEKSTDVKLPIKTGEQYYSVGQVAELLHVKKPTVYRYIYAQKLIDIVLGGKRRIAKSEIERFANSYNQGERLRTVKKVSF